MNNEIICFGDMFGLTQNLKSGDKIITILTDELGKTIPSLCYSNQTNKVHLYGNEMYIEGIVVEINENADYANIEIKVN